MDESELRKAVKGFLVETTSIIEQISHIDWKESDGMVPVIFRAILRRQYESLSSIVEISGSERGYSAVSLLRPACEELIWIKYLKHIGIQDANELLRLMAVTEIGKTIEAQLEYAGPDAMKSLGFPVAFTSAQSASAFEAKRRLRVLGRRLNWGNSGRGEIPSVFSIAKVTDNLALYKFLYHATSKFVHFSTHELMRRAWGRPGALSISSDTFARYWSAFSLRWGLQFYLETLLEGLDWIEDQDSPELSEARIMEAAEAIRRFGLVPIVTAEELHWPFPS
jgi:Family of unknown function (DUF5677)